MNILPKKRWHVRTRENIARVRRDEAKAAEEEQTKQERIKLAEREARRSLLLSKNKGCSQEDPSDGNRITVQEHINFFEEVEQGTAESKKRNIEHDKEQKEEREKYEKQIGYLTYLGQDTNEALGKKSWYDIAPDRSEVKGEADLKGKLREDPLQTIRKHTEQCKKLVESKCLERKLSNSATPSKSEDRDNINCRTPEKKKYSKKRSRSTSIDNEISESSKIPKTDEKHQSLQLLRMKRLEREKEERRKADILLSKLKKNSETVEEKTLKPENFKAKYNSQFNPQLARQNYNL